MGICVCDITEWKCPRKKTNMCKCIYGQAIYNTHITQLFRTSMNVWLFWERSAAFWTIYDHLNQSWFIVSWMSTALWMFNHTRESGIRTEIGPSTILFLVQFHPLLPNFSRRAYRAELTSLWKIYLRVICRSILLYKRVLHSIKQRKYAAGKENIPITNLFCYLNRQIEPLTAVSDLP